MTHARHGLASEEVRVKSEKVQEDDFYRFTPLGRFNPLGRYDTGRILFGVISTEETLVSERSISIRIILTKIKLHILDSSVGVAFLRMTRVVQSLGLCHSERESGRI